MGKITKLTDESKMPFGKYQGKAMADVPAEYLLWIYENDKCSEQVKLYVEENMEAIKLEIKEL